MSTKTRRTEPMDLKRFDAFCERLPKAQAVVQWGDGHVWKVGGKVFALARQDQGAPLHVSFKCSAIAFENLKDQPGLRPAPYLASRGLTWLQRTSVDAMDDASLRDHVIASYWLVVSGLTKKAREQLNVSQTEPARAGSSPSPAFDKQQRSGQ